MSMVQASHLAKHRLGVTMGQHCLIVDQPRTSGGDDMGPTPVQFFSASLVACAAHYAASFLARHDLPADGLKVEGDYAMADEKPPRLTSMSVTIPPPPGLSDNRRAGLLAVASHCTIHNTIRQPPRVTFGWSDPKLVAIALNGGGD